MKTSLTPAVVSIVALSAALSAPASAKTVDREFHETFDVAAGARLELFHGDGNVELESWDRDVIEVHVRYRAEFKGGGVHSKPDFEVDFEQDGEVVRVRGREIGRKGIGIFFNQEHEYSYTIQAPSYVVLDMEGDDGDVAIDGWRSDIACRLDDGDLKMSDTESGAVRVEVQDGDIEIDRFTGKLDIRVDDGDITITNCDSSELAIRARDGDVILDRCRGSFEITVDDGNVDVTRASVSKLDVRAQDGDLDLEVESATDLNLDVAADDGDVSVELGAGISASFSIETDDGDIRVSPADWILTNKDHRVTGEIGGGKGTIRIVTNDGDVSLRSE